MLHPIPEAEDEYEMSDAEATVVSGGARSPTSWSQSKSAVRFKDSPQEAEEDGYEYRHYEETSSRSNSPTPTIQSITESLFASLSVEKHGRMVNATNPMYSMAADDDEADRQIEEHRLYKYLFTHRFEDPLYICPREVEEVLNAEDEEMDGHGGEAKLIMDLGTGTADWAIDMARRYPKADVLGIDVSTLRPDAESIPENCRIEVDDVNMPLDHYYNRASMVHIRLLAMGIKDYPGLINKCTNCLLPGGILHILETDFRPFRANRFDSLMTKPSKNPLSPTYCASAHWLSCLSTAMHRTYAHCDAAANLERWFKQEKELEFLESHEIFLPVFGLFPNHLPEGRVFNEIARMVSSDFIAYMSNIRPLLLDEFSVIQLDSLERQVIAEVRNPERHLFVRVVVCCARKRRRT